MMSLSWITLYPYWYQNERKTLDFHYPDLLVDEFSLRKGTLRYFGELVVRPPGKSFRYPISLTYPQGTPYECPIICPVDKLPEWKPEGTIKSEPSPKYFDHRHQMPDGNLCLFQRETRTVANARLITGLDALNRTEHWFIGQHTNRWPPDTAQSEIESHYDYLSDVLLPARFYDPKMTGHGRLFFVPDYSRRHEMPNRTPPLILTAMTQENDIVIPIDGLTELRDVYPWVESIAWESSQLASITDFIDVGPKHMKHGYWFSLPIEPKPFHDGRGFLRALAPSFPNGSAWDVFSGILSNDLSRLPSHLLGLKFPSREGDVEWLIIWIKRDTVKFPPDHIFISDNEKREAFETSRLYCIRTHRLSEDVLQLRNRSVVDSAIKSRSVALIGLGALGSKIAELLAQAGIKKFFLCDSDTIKIGNVSRHIAGIRDFGASKINVVSRRLRDINPFIKFSPGNIWPQSIVQSLDVLRDFISRADLVISTTADEAVESTINQIAILDQKDVIYGRSLRGASLGRIFLVRPGKDACKKCLSDYMIAGRKNEVTPDDWIDIPESEETILLHECGRPVIAGSAVDLTFIAATITRVALDYLEGRLKNENHWIWTRSQAQDVNPTLKEGMTTFPGFLKPRNNCAVCSRPSVKELTLSDSVISFIKSQIEQSPDAETGGILIGFQDDNNRAIVIKATGPGPKAERSAAIFRRDVAFVQAELDIASVEFGRRGLYIGEWHSHLVPDSSPSAIDIDSLFGIAEAPNYMTMCPVMVIGGYDKSVGKIGKIRAWVFPLGGRIFSVPIKTVPKGEIGNIPEKAE